MRAQKSDSIGVNAPKTGPVTVLISLISSWMPFVGGLSDGTLFYMGSSPSQPFLNFEHIEENFKDMLSSSETPLTFSNLVEMVATQHINNNSDINGIFAWGVDDNGNIVDYITE